MLFELQCSHASGPIKRMWSCQATVMGRIGRMSSRAHGWSEEEEVGEYCKALWCTALTIRS